MTFAEVVTFDLCLDLFEAIVFLLLTFHLQIVMCLCVYVCGCVRVGLTMLFIKFDKLWFAARFIENISRRGRLAAMFLFFSVFYSLYPCTSSESQNIGGILVGYFDE